MAKLNLRGITINVNGYTLNNELPYFQKAVPQALRNRVGKSVIKIPLHPNNGHCALQCQQLNQSYEQLFCSMKNDPGMVVSAAKLAAIARIARINQTPAAVVANSDDKEDVLLTLLSGLVTRPNQATQSTSLVSHPQLSLLLSEAFTVYLDNHRNGKDKNFANSSLTHWNKLIDFLGDTTVHTVTREDARKYRDHRLASGLAPSSVAREINAIRAIFTKAIRELSLNIPNQFAGIEVFDSNRNLNDRLPYTSVEITLLVREALKIDDEQRRIVIALAFTGARLAEVVGLRKQDLDLKNSSIHIVAHNGRRLKNHQSAREIPLLPCAFDALRRQSEDAAGDFIFPSYTHEKKCNADSASATLNKWAKKFVPNRTMHCFRHALRDQLRAVNCPESIAKELGGWSNARDISAQYGQGHPLHLKRQFIEQAYGSTLLNLI